MMLQGIFLFLRHTCPSKYIPYHMDKGIKDLVYHAALLHDVGLLQYSLLCGQLDAMLVSQSTGRCIALASHIRCRNLHMSGAAFAILK